MVSCRVAERIDKYNSELIIHTSDTPRLVSELFGRNSFLRKLSWKVRYLACTKFLHFGIAFRTAFGRISSPDGTNFPEILEIFENRPDQNRDISKTTSTFSKIFWCFGKLMDSSFEFYELERLAKSFFKFLVRVDLVIFRKFTFTSPPMSV